MAISVTVNENHTVSVLKTNSTMRSAEY